MPKHNQIIDTVDEFITAGVRKNILHLTAEVTKADGRTVHLEGKKLINFASYSYLGLEVNPELKKAAIDAVEKYGTQFGASRAYISIDLYEELESLFERIFNAPTLIAPSTTLAHQAVIPVLVRDEDAIILDQHVHASVQMTVKMMQARRIPVELLRHNRLDTLEERIKSLGQKYRRIWYMLDGVYSMYGDYAPLKELYQLLDKYPQLNIYVDDAHGMSWAGIHGSGYALSQIDLHPQMILVTSLNKAFAGAGGAIVLPDREQYRKVRTCGGTLIFSTPIQPPMLGVNVGSAKIHLSDEITTLQRKLKKRIAWTGECLRKHGLPVISKTDSPIFYVGLGKPRVGYNMVRRMMNEGYYLSIGLFPAVSMRCTGLRGCVNANHSLEDIEQMTEVMAHHFPLALAEEGVDQNDIHKSFKLPLISVDNARPSIPKSPLWDIRHSQTILDVDKTEWNEMLGSNGSFDWDGLDFLERTFSGNPEPESNWEFHYYIVRDMNGQPVLATFFTVAICKDDLFAPVSVSEKMERERIKDPYYMCSKVLMMGSLLTEGNHLYLDKKNDQWRDATLLLLADIMKLQEKAEATVVNLRDFEESDQELRDLLQAEGFVKIDLPEANIINQDLLTWESIDEYLPLLSSKSRGHIRRDVLKYEQYYEVEMITQATAEEIDIWYGLYKNVKQRSLSLNTFDLPKKAFGNMVEDSNWEVIQLTLKEEFNDREKNRPIAIGFIYKTEKTYCPMILGLDYYYLYSYKNYKQILFQVVKRANYLGLETVYLGLTANIEKRKFGAIPVPKVAYIQTSDTYNMEVLEMSRVEGGNMAVSKPMDVSEET